MSLVSKEDIEVARACLEAIVRALQTLDDDWPSDLTQDALADASNCLRTLRMLELNMP